MSAPEAAATQARPASERITDEVGSSPGVRTGWGRRGEFSFRVGSHEIGHLHGDRAAPFFLPQGLWAELVQQGRIGPHPVFPGKRGPATRAIAGEKDIADVIALMRLNDDRVPAGDAVGPRREAPAATSPDSAASPRAGTRGGERR
ncbi:MAG TPA: luciferase family protein [Solirubrobacteraceae bacterium]|nr:luciferase family protein [Solirubrobacteraceae bacterium]